MRYPITILSALLIVIATGCESRPDREDIDTTGVEEDTAQVVPEGTEEALDTSAALGIDLADLLEGGRHRAPGEQQLAVLDRLNEPDRVSVETQPNRHVRGQIDTLRTLHFAGAEITVYHASDGKELLKNVIVTGRGLASPEGIRVGDSRSDVEAELGTPPERRDGAYVYEQNGPMPTQFYIHFEDDTVSRLEWRFPID